MTNQALGCQAGDRYCNRRKLVYRVSCLNFATIYAANKAVCESANPAHQAAVCCSAVCSGTSYGVPLPCLLTELPGQERRMLLWACSQQTCHQLSPATANPQDILAVDQRDDLTVRVRDNVQSKPPSSCCQRKFAVVCKSQHSVCIIQSHCQS